MKGKDTPLQICVIRYFLEGGYITLQGVILDAFSGANMTSFNGVSTEG